MMVCLGDLSGPLFPFFFLLFLLHTVFSFSPIIFLFCFTRFFLLSAQPREPVPKYTFPGPAEELSSLASIVTCHDPCPCFYGSSFHPFPLPLQHQAGCARTCRLRVPVLFPHVAYLSLGAWACCCCTAAALLQLLGSRPSSGRPSHENPPSYDHHLFAFLPCVSAVRESTLQLGSSR